MKANTTRGDHGTDAPVKPAQKGKFVLPKQVSGKGVVQHSSGAPSPKLNSTARDSAFASAGAKFESGWPTNMDHDPRLIAKVWKLGANHPYQVRTADGTFSLPKGLGQKNRGALTKNKAEARDYRERPQPAIAGLQDNRTRGNRNVYATRGSGSSPSGGVKRGK